MFYSVASIGANTADEHPAATSEQLVLRPACVLGQDAPSRQINNIVVTVVLRTLGEYHPICRGERMLEPRQRMAWPSLRAGIQ